MQRQRQNRQRSVNSRTPACSAKPATWTASGSRQVRRRDQRSNPATARSFGRCAKIGWRGNEEAIEAANRAFPAWSKKQRKSAPLFCAAGSIDDGEPGGSGAADDPEQGKPLTESKSEVLMRLLPRMVRRRRPNACMGTPSLSISG